MKIKPTVASIVKKAAEDWGIKDTYSFYSKSINKNLLERTLKTKGVMAARADARTMVRLLYPRYSL